VTRRVLIDPEGVQFGALHMKTQADRISSELRKISRSSIDGNKTMIMARLFIAWKSSRKRRFRYEIALVSKL